MAILVLGLDSRRTRPGPLHCLTTSLNCLSRKVTGDAGVAELATHVHPPPRTLLEMHMYLRLKYSCWPTAVFPKQSSHGPIYKCQWMHKAFLLSAYVFWIKIQLTYKNVQVSGFFLVNSHHHLIPEHFHHPPRHATVLALRFSASVTTHLPSVLMILPTPGTSCKQTHTICGHHMWFCT